MLQKKYIVKSKYGILKWTKEREFLTMKNFRKNVLKSRNGITLIALVITIIVLLILAGISISMLSGNNSILSRAGQAKDDTIVGQEKEQVELAYISVAVNELGNDVTDGELQIELNKSVGDGKTDVSKNEDNTLNVLFKDTNHNYNVDNGIVSKVNISDSSDDLEKLRQYFTGKSIELLIANPTVYENRINYEYRQVANCYFTYKNIEYVSYVNYPENNILGVYYKEILTEDNQKAIFGYVDSYNNAIYTHTPSKIEGCSSDLYYETGQYIQSLSENTPK